MKVALLALAALSLAHEAHADPMPGDALSPRAVSRAGVGLVSEDTGLAIFSNPAALARRGQSRLAVGLRLADDNTAITTPQTSSPVVRDKSGAAANAALGYAQGLGDRWVVAAAFIERSMARRYPVAQFGQIPDDVTRLFPTRYAGLEGRSVRQTVSVGAALRVNDWIAIGASVGVEALELESSRTLWAGFSGRDTIGDPLKDVRLGLSARNRLVPRASVGVLAAPIDVPLELAGAVSARPPSTLSGEARATSTTNLGNPPDIGETVDATLERPGRVVLEAGLRYLGQRVVVELGGSATMLVRRKAAETWRIDGLSIVDESGAEGSLTEAPALLDTRPHFRLGAAVDVAIIEGFLWIVGGYGLTSSAVADARRNPLLPVAMAHRAGAGFEAVWSSFTVSLGISRSFSPTESVDESTAVTLQNPFGAGAGTAPAGVGSYRHSADRGALTIEYAF